MAYRPSGGFQARAEMDAEVAVLESQHSRAGYPRAELAQLVERQLPKLNVAGSIPVLRSIFPTSCALLTPGGTIESGQWE